MYLGGETLLKPYKLDFYALLFVREGTLILNINYQKLEIKKGEAFFAGPGQFHSFTEFSDVKCIVVSFTEEFLLKNVKEDAVIENFKLLLNFSHVKKLKTDTSNVNSINHLLDVLFLESRNRFDHLQTFVLQNVLAAILYLFERSNSRNAQPDDADKYHKLALNYKLLLTQKLKEHTNLQYYLDQLNVSQSTLQLATKTVFQKSPKAILDELLIFCAKRMLADPSKRIQEIGYELGFSEATNFSKFFLNISKNT